MSWHLKAIIPRAKEESSEYINTNYIHAGGGRLVSVRNWKAPAI